MSIKSMTGFSRAEGARGGVSWHWEVRSVNGRGLDVRLRLPAGSEPLEPKAREAAARYVSRGSVTISLNSDRRSGSLEIRINEAGLAQVMKAAARVRTLTDSAPPRVDGLLSVKGVLDVIEQADTPEEAEARNESMLQTLEEALRALVEARAAEGARIEAALRGQLDEIERLVAQVAASPARSPAAIEARLKDQVARLLEASNAFDPARLHQEAVLIATRADVEEELQRLNSHISAARELLAESGAVGRKFDFLAQEFNREANTLCSKANDTQITRAGLALKTVIDQLREQVQNIE